MADRATADRRPRALAVAVDLGDRSRPIEPELDELEALIAAAGAVQIARIVQKRAAVDPASLIGSGKLREIADSSTAMGAELIVVFNSLRPRQRRTFEAAIPLPIVDRNMLILDIFARHARSREGKLQVELAQLRYRQSNLIGSGSDLSRLGGGIGTRGPGETKLEVDRRRIASRIKALRSALEGVRRSRTTRRRAARDEPLVALVGYTNAGKSSLLNRLARSDAFVADQPFATLDPMLREAYLRPDLSVRISDTVGFITDLPRELVTAFAATLEELGEAALLVHVLDAANPHWPRQKESVEAILRELGLEHKPVLYVLNKMDAVAGAEAVLHADGELPPRTLMVSAKSGQGFAELKDALANALTRSAPAERV